MSVRWATSKVNVFWQRGLTRVAPYGILYKRGKLQRNSKLMRRPQILDPEDQDTDAKDVEDEEPIPDGEPPVDTDGVDAAVGLIDDPEVSLED